VECCARPCSGGSDAGAKTGRWSAAAAFIAGGGEEGGESGSGMARATQRERRGPDTSARVAWGGGVRS
jgi:hypothetical protein